MLGSELPRMSFFSEVAETAKRKKPHARKYLSDIAAKNNMTIVGFGAEKYVVECPDDPSKVASVDFLPHSPEFSKAIFYTHRIYSKLWPYNFPKPRAVNGSTDELMISMILNDRIYKSNFRIRNLIDRRLFTYHKGAHIFEVKYPFSAVKQNCRDFKIPLVIDDSIKGNFIIGRDGGEYYVDTIHNFKADIDLPVENFINFMDSKNIEQGEQRAIISEIQRANYLYEQYASGK